MSQPRSRTSEELEEDRLIAIARFRSRRLGESVNVADAPQPGEYCRETMLGSRKADFVIGLYDRRIMAIECKVSNSALNSIKRLNNDAAVKAVVWRREFGDRQVVPTAVLSGVFKASHLEQAQERGLSLFWEHGIEALMAWIESTGEGRPQA